MRKVIFGTLITIVVLGTILLVDRSVRTNRPVPDNSSEKGKFLPTSSKLTNFRTKEVVSLEKYKGKALLINFWATWCDACMAEMPSIQKLYDILKNEGLEVIGVNVDDNPEKVVQPVIDRLGLSIPIFFEGEGSTLSQEFEVVAIPFSIVTDREHRIVWSESGERDWASESVIQEMRKVLK